MRAKYGKQKQVMKASQPVQTGTQNNSEPSGSKGNVQTKRANKPDQEQNRIASHKCKSETKSTSEPTIRTRNTNN